MRKHFLGLSFWKYGQKPENKPISKGHIIEGKLSACVFKGNLAQLSLYRKLGDFGERQFSTVILSKDELADYIRMLQYTHAKME